MLCLAALLAPAGAAADADPASDILLVQNVFYPYSPSVPLSMQRSLNREVARAKRAGFPIKVALIGRRIDLGGIPELFGKPSRYARFLDTEISFRTLQPVLVVTAAGLGGSGLGRSAMATLAALPRPASDQPGVLAETAIADVAKLAAAAGHPIAVEAPGARAAATGGPSAALLIGLAIALVVVALALVTVRDRRRPIR
jgi:hypothetical protein